MRGNHDGSREAEGYTVESGGGGGGGERGGDTSRSKETNTRESEFLVFDPELHVDEVGFT